MSTPPHPHTHTLRSPQAGRTPLLCAAGNPCIEVIESLILGPPEGTLGLGLGEPALHIADYNGATPLSLASENGYVADGAANVMQRYEKASAP